MSIKKKKEDLKQNVPFKTLFFTYSDLMDQSTLTNQRSLIVCHPAWQIRPNIA